MFKGPEREREKQEDQKIRKEGPTPPTFLIF
jgi:hypothetical protein